MVLIADFQKERKMGKTQIERLKAYVAAFENGSLASRGAINDRTFDEQRLNASKNAIATSDETDVYECLQWWNDAIKNGLLIERKKMTTEVENIELSMMTVAMGSAIGYGELEEAEACDEMSKLSGLVQGPSGEFVPAGDQQNAAMPRTGPDLTGVDAYALQRELERRGLLVQLWSPEDFEFIGNEDEEAADLSGDTLEQIQHQAFEQCRRSLDEITAQRGNEHLGDWWAMNKQPILEQFKPKDEYPRPGM